MEIITEIGKVISWLIASLAGLFGIAKTLPEVGKLLNKNVMPDIKVDEKAEEIVKQQHLARELVLFTGIESAYNIARGLIVALNFALVMHYGLKFAQWMKKKEES